jgi:sterol desaturase/sphingolipid hydroxylase (fatty acid hydroxylase superfamily)
MLFFLPGFFFVFVLRLHHHCLFFSGAHQMDNSDWNAACVTFAITWIVCCTTLSWLDWSRNPWYVATSVRPHRKPFQTNVLKTIWPDVCINSIVGYGSGWILCRIFNFTAYVSERAEIVFCRLLCVAVLASFWFFHSHLVMHNYAPLRIAHSIHHEFRQPYAFTSLYCHTTEMMFVNWPLLFVCPVVVGLRGLGLCIWAAALALYVSIVHCGHQLLPSWILDVKYHDDHHRYAQGTHLGSEWLFNWYRFKGWIH